MVEAIETGAIRVPRFESDTSPASRPIVECIIGKLPAGGTGFERSEWTDEQRSAIAAEFMDSPEGATLTGPRDADIVHDLLWFTTDYSGGYPLRWSFLNVQILLTDWYPRKVEEVLRLCDGCAEAMFDVEMRTAFRRVLARTAAAEPDVFRRRSKATTAAAAVAVAVAWTVATANELLLPRGPLTAKELLAHFGVTGTVVNRARPSLRAFGVDDRQTADDLAVGTTVAAPVCVSAETYDS